MGMRVDDTGARRKIRRAIQAMSPPQQKKLWRMAARHMIRIQRERIEAGIGSSGRQMPPYSPGYALQRRRSGRQASVRTLVWTGQMLGSRRIIKLSARGANIGWRPGFQAEKATSNQAIAPFTAPTPDERKALIQFLIRRIKKGVRTGKPSTL